MTGARGIGRPTPSEARPIASPDRTAFMPRRGVGHYQGRGRDRFAASKAPADPSMASDLPVKVTKLCEASGPESGAVRRNLPRGESYSGSESFEGGRGPTVGIHGVVIGPPEESTIKNNRQRRNPPSRLARRGPEGPAVRERVGLFADERRSGPLQPNPPGSTIATVHACPYAGASSLAIEAHAGSQPNLGKRPF